MIPTPLAPRCACAQARPDVVLIGKMRDLETIASAITIAETGHLVFATLRTNSAAQSIDRMIDVFPAPTAANPAPQLSQHPNGYLRASVWCPHDWRQPVLPQQKS